MGTQVSAERVKGSGLDWFVRRGTAVQGPYSSARVRHFVLEEKLAFDDEVSADRREWQRLGSVPEVIPLQLRSNGAEYMAEQDATRENDRLRAVRAIVVSALLVIGLTVTVSLMGPPRQEAERDCHARPVPGVDLSGCRLDGMRLTGVALSGASLASASLRAAGLSGADLTAADLRYADLSDANLSYARLVAANLKGADLRRADLTNVVLDDADLRYADLTGARLGGGSLAGARLDSAIWVDGRSCAATPCPPRSNP